MTPELKPRADLAADIGERVIATADNLRLYIGDTFAGMFTFVWAGHQFNVMIEMESDHDS